MPKATSDNGKLTTIKDCWIEVPGAGVQDGYRGIQPLRIEMNNLPDISDSKSASYSDEAAIGRSSPFKNYSHSENRTISWTCHFFVLTKKGDDPGNVNKILSYLRALEACTYPLTRASGTPYAPPPICHVKCGKLLSDTNPICVILKSYSVKFDTSLPWDEESYLPYKIDVDLQFEVVYNQSDLPGAERVMKLGA